MSHKIRIYKFWWDKPVPFLKTSIQIMQGWQNVDGCCYFL